MPNPVEPLHDSQISTLQRETAGSEKEQSDKSRSLSTIRVLHVINGEHYSGAERVQDLLGLNLPEFGYAVGYACLKPDQFDHNRQAVDCPLFSIPMRRRFDFRPIRRLINIVHQEQYKIIHAHTPRTLFIASLVSRLTNVPLVYHVHSPASNDSTRWLQNHINATIEWFFMNRAKAIIPVSEKLAVRLRKIGLKQVITIPNGVPHRLPRGILMTDKKDWTLGLVALFRPRKGTEILLESLAQLRARGHSVRLRAVGGFETPEYEKEIKSLVESMGIADVVTWTGFTNDVDTELQKIDLMVLPSLFGEGTPMVVLEAMATGIPIVATTVGGTPEVIRDHREGILVEPSSAAALTRGIELFLDKDVDYNMISLAALKRHDRQYSARNMARHVASVYDSIVRTEN